MQVLMQVADHLLLQPGEQVWIGRLREHVLLNHFPLGQYFLMILVDLPLFPEGLAFITSFLQALLNAKTVLEEKLSIRSVTRALFNSFSLKAYVRLVQFVINLPGSSPS